MHQRGFAVDSQDVEIVTVDPFSWRDCLGHKFWRFFDRSLETAGLSATMM